MKGNYSYTTDGGLTYIVNTITTNLGNNEPSDNSLYNCCPYEIGGEFDFTFKDIIKKVVVQYSSLWVLVKLNYM